MAFEPLLAQLDETEQLVLGCVADARPQGLDAAGLSKWMQDRGRVCNRQQLAAAVKHLTELELIAAGDQAETWNATWTGLGVANWRNHVLLADSTAPVHEPWPGENGRSRAEHPCSQYRDTLFRPGYCWCGFFRTEHVGELPGLVEKMLDGERRQRIKDDFWERGSGRSFAEYLAELSEVEQVVLHCVVDHRAEGIRQNAIVELLMQNTTWSSRQLRHALEHLVELQLIVEDSPNWFFPSWDGVGVAHWSSHVQLGGNPANAPRPGENGSTIAVAPCAQYRACLSASGDCWCGYSQAEHADQALRAAEAFVRPADGAF